jgi:hypothetical protein
MFDEHAVSADPGINHGDVDSTEQSFGAFDAFECVVAYCYIANDHVHLGASGSQTIRYVVQRVFATSDEHESCTIASSTLRNCATDAGRRAGNQQ